MNGEPASRGGGVPERIRVIVLSTREWEVLDMICDGMSMREISRSLFLAEDTVYGHVKHTLRKLGVNSRAEAVSAAGILREIVDGA